MTFGTKAALIGLTLALAPLAAQAQAPAAGDAARGATLFKQRCGVCHSVVVDTATRPAPTMKAISGRKAGVVPNFRYSPAMKNSNITWDKAKLDQYLAAPAKMLPGTFMMIAVANPKDRGDIVAYLDTLKQ
jgi:cytochrome c